MIDEYENYSTQKKTLDELLSTKEVATGKEVIQQIKEQEKQQKEFEESVKDKLRTGELSEHTEKILLRRISSTVLILGG